MSTVLAHAGGPLPRPGPTSWVTDWHVSPVLAVGVVLAAAVYLYGVRRLSERGDVWPVGRTLAWGGGLLVVLYATSGGVAAYDTTLFSAHMVQHMLLAMVAPVPLVLAAPLTLALRTLPGGARTGPRGLVLRAVHSRVARVVGHPLVAFTIFIANPFALYFTPLYEATLASGLLHEWLHVHFLVTGYLFFWTLVGVDPTPGRPSFPLRLLVVFASLPFHAFLGIAIMSSTALLAPDHYGEVARTLAWYSDPLGDQELGGGILWASGDLFAFAFLGVLFLQWSRSEQRAAVRVDRRLDRQEARAGAGTSTAQAAPAGAPPRPDAADDDGELAAYNGYLARLAARPRD